MTENSDDRLDLKEFIQDLYDEDPIIKQTEANFIFESGDRKLKKKFIEDLFDMNYLADRYSEFAMKYVKRSEENKRKIKSRVKNTLSEMADLYYMDNKPKLHSEEALENSNIATSHYNFADFMLFRSLLRDAKGKMYVYDMVKNALTDIDPDLYMQSLPKEYRQNFVPHPCVFQYDPYNLSPTKVIEMYRQQVTQINLYIPPSWRLKSSSNIKDPRCPKIFGKFFYHLFPNKEARAYVICWLKNMILDRNYTYLGLNGNKGIGKNVFVDMCEKLVGEENFGKGKLSLLNDKFNTVLENKRLIFLDELNVDKKRHTVLKDYINEKQNIEGKGVDANNVTITYNSFIISNNDIFDVYVEHDDRRFSYMPLTETPLKESFGNDGINELIEAINDPQMIRELGEFIINYEHEVYEDRNYVWKCEKFWDLVFSSLHAWQQHLVEYLKDNPDKSVALAFIRDQAEDIGFKFPTNTSKVDSFLKNYRHKGEYKVGHLEKVKRNWMLFSDWEDDNVEDEL